MHQNGDDVQKKAMRHEPGDRLTITLRSGQREVLRAIADRNHVSLAFAVRYALDSFINQQKDVQIPLDFPKL